VADALNNRPRKTLGWRTPAEVLATNYTRDHDTVLRRQVESALHSVVGMNDPAGLGVRELTDTMRAPPAAASARCMPVASAK
jgi:hypothetical protein